MTRRVRIGAVALSGVLAGLGCRDSTSPALTLTLSAAGRAVSFREDSLQATTDSVGVGITGANAGTTGWVATHGGGSWLTLTSASGIGNGTVRWTRDTTGLIGGTYVDTITVTLQVPGGGSAQLVDSLIIREVPAQYISVRRAWRPGERDSAAQYIVRTRAWGEYSDIAPLALAAWDSATDVIQNPAWHPTAARAPGVHPAAQFASGWGSAGIDIRIVFDSLPDVAGVQKDSLDWVMTFWWNPADSTWKGYVVRATTAATFSYQTLNTTAFDAAGGKSGQGGGEARLASGTYWEAILGQYRITSNSNYGALQTITSGPFLGGNVQFGLMGGRLNSVTMLRITGTDLPLTQTINYNFGATPIGSQRMFCYFAPVTPPGGYTQCTGAAFARLVALARAGRAMEAFSGPVPGRGSRRSR